MNREQYRARDRERYKNDPDRRTSCNARSIAHYFANHEVELRKRREWAKANRAKKRAITRAWELANPEHHRMLGRMKAARRNAKKRAATIQKFTWQALAARMAAQGDRCVYCGGPFEHVDHFKPLALGGPHCLANLRPSCRRCNAKKGAKHPLAWLTER